MPFSQFLDVEELLSLLEINKDKQKKEEENIT